MPIAPSQGMDTPADVQMSPTVAAPACVVLRSCPIAPAENPALVKSMMPEIAVPVAPTTCGWNGMLVVVTSMSHGVLVSAEQV